jgi:hypothetical protein
METQWTPYPVVQAVSTLMAVTADSPSASDTAFSHPELWPNSTISPDGQTILWVPPSADGRSGSVLMRGTIGSTEAVELLRVPRGEVLRQSVGPDGRWIAYVSTESGVPEVYVQSFPQGGRKMQVTTGGTSPVDGLFWSRSGRSVFIGMPASGGLVEVRLDLVAGRVVERDTVLNSGPNLRWYGVLPGDSVFLGRTTGLLPGESPRLVIAQGMLTEIRRRLEGRK